ncbi:hypothetical protein TWF718_008600 [Orbilia javanica]|uniref:Uncharacterized protein n=1 Tax=Orbilia javanica TaxID=47235 RepID=A0AAN8MTF8_9PEZI
MLQKIFLYTSLLITPLLTSAYVPYVDDNNVHNSYSTAFEFPDNTYSRALCTRTRCPPLYFQPLSNATNATRGSFKRPQWSGESWSKVYLKAGEDLSFGFGVPHIPALEFPSFRPDVYILGKCLPPPRAFGRPRPQLLDFPSNQLDIPHGCGLQGLKFHLSDPGWRPTEFFEKDLEATLLKYLEYKVPVGCDGEIYIVVKALEKRITEHYVSIGGSGGWPPYESTDGVAKMSDAKAWAKGQAPGIGKFCQRRGFWEKE